MGINRVEVCPESATKGWFFVVPIETHGSSIDVLPTTFQRTRILADGRKAVFTCDTWTQGIPPLPSLDRGWVFYTTARDAVAPWSTLRRAVVVQIFSVTPGSITFDDIIVDSGVIVDQVRSACSPLEFLAFLKNGILPGAIDKACAGGEACLCSR